ncbi:hypothetical protein QWA68_016196 [Fusarium oxysporum]|nr:hypothetical protein QWA68_016196 [Fusarium oxysporum]
MSPIHPKLPQDPYLVDFIHHSQSLPPDHVIVVDHETGVKATITELITAVCEYRVRLGQELGMDILCSVREGEEVFVATMFPPGYDFLVAFLAILSLGVGVVPLATKLLPQEAAYFVSQSGSRFILCDQKRLKLANTASGIVTNSENIWEHTKLQVLCLEAIHPSSISSPCLKVEFNPDWTPSVEAPSLILFTSGTTGPPKGAIFPRKYLHNLSRVVIESFQVTRQDIFLHSRGVHWVTGVRYFSGIILAGARVEFCESRMSPTWWCRRVAEGGISMCYDMPRVWMSIMRAIENLPSLPYKGQISIDNVKEGLKSVRLMMSGGTPAIRKVIDYWNHSLPRGKYVNIWGITELGGMVTYHDADTRSSDTRCVGRLLPNASVKFDENGQACVKSPLMFLRYVSDPERTKQALDEEGFFRTGDAVEIHGNKVFISGRIGLDYIRFKGLKMCAADIEEKLNDLPYVHESAVMPVPDEEFGQRVAAVIHVKFQTELPVLKRIRVDLESSLPQYKLPTILTLVDVPLPRTTTGKLAKTAIRKDYVETEVAPAVYKERWHISYESGPRRTCIWDWGGMH